MKHDNSLRMMLSIFYAPGLYVLTPNGDVTEEATCLLWKRYIIETQKRDTKLLILILNILI